VEHVFTDQHRHTPVLGIKGDDAAASCKVALLVEHPVGGKIDLTMGVAYLPILEVDTTVEKMMLAGLRDQADENRHLL